jgi:hypothetical protein
VPAKELNSHVNSVEKHLKWDNKWDSQDVISFKRPLEANKQYTVTLYGFVECCDSNSSAQFQKPGDGWAIVSATNLKLVNPAASCVSGAGAAAAGGTGKFADSCWGTSCKQANQGCKKDSPGAGGKFDWICVNDSWKAASINDKGDVVADTENTNAVKENNVDPAGPGGNDLNKQGQSQVVPGKPAAVDTNRAKLAEEELKEQARLDKVREEEDKQFQQSMQGASHGTCSTPIKFPAEPVSAGSMMPLSCDAKSQEWLIGRVEFQKKEFQAMIDSIQSELDCFVKALDKYTSLTDAAVAKVGQSDDKSDNKSNEKSDSD